MEMLNFLEGDAIFIWGFAILDEANQYLWWVVYIYALRQALLFKFPGIYTKFLLDIITKIYSVVNSVFFTYFLRNISNNFVQNISTWNSRVQYHKSVTAMIDFF